MLRSGTMASSKVAGFLQGKSWARSGLLITSMQECEHLIGLMSLSSVTKGRFTRRWWPTLVATLPPTSPHPAQAALFPSPLAAPVTMQHAPGSDLTPHPPGSPSSLPEDPEDCCSSHSSPPSLNLLAMVCRFNEVFRIRAANAEFMGTCNTWSDFQRSKSLLEVHTATHFFLVRCRWTTTHFVRV